MCHPHQLIGVKNVELVLLVVLLIRKKSLESSSESSGCFRNNWYTPQKMFGHPFIESVLLTYLRIGYNLFFLGTEASKIVSGLCCSLTLELVIFFFLLHPIVFLLQPTFLLSFNG